MECSFSMREEESCLRGRCWAGFDFVCFRRRRRWLFRVQRKSQSDSEIGRVVKSVVRVFVVEGEVIVSSEVAKLRIPLVSLLRECSRECGVACFCEHSCWNCWSIWAVSDFRSAKRASSFRRHFIRILSDSEHCFSASLILFFST